MNKTTLNIHIKHFISKKLKKLLWYFKFKCIFYMIYLCRAAEENMPIIGNIFILMKHCEVCLRTIIMIYWRSLCHRQNVRKEATTTNCHLISVFGQIVIFTGKFCPLLVRKLLLYFIFCLNNMHWLTDSLLHTGPCRHKLKCFLVEISRNLQHLPKLSWRADLIRKPFVAITIMNLQETWRFVIRFDLILNLIVDIKTNLVWIWYEVQ